MTQGGKDKGRDADTAQLDLIPDDPKRPAPTRPEPPDDEPDAELPVDDDDAYAAFDDLEGEDDGGEEGPSGDVEGDADPWVGGQGTETEDWPAVTPDQIAAELAARSEATSPIEVASLRPRQSLVAGVVLGGAIGDAMGHPTEFIGSLESIRSKYGPKGVTRFELYWDRDGRRFAPYTDDTQMAEIVLRSLVASRDAHDDLDAAMERMAEGFVEWSDHPQGGHRAPGNACMSGCRALARGVHWSEAGGATAGGCGSVMRAYPFGVLFADDLQRAERWSVEHSKLTHRDPIALAACAAMAIGVARALRGDSVDMVVSEMVAAACRYSAKTAAMMATAIDEARSGVGPEITLDRLRAWAAHEAIAAGVYLFVRHPDDPVAAILEGANTPGDSDSIATVAGALVGARTGAAAFPTEWIRDVERSAELVELAVRAAR